MTIDPKNPKDPKDPNPPNDADIPLDPHMPNDPYRVYTPQHRTLIRRWFDWLLPRKGWVFALALVWLVAGIATFLNLKRDLFPDLTLPSLSLLIQSPRRRKFGRCIGRSRAMLPMVSLPTSPYAAASGISPMPALSSTIQTMRSNAMVHSANR